MASGRLAASAPAATTNTKLYEPAASTLGTGNLTITNRGAAATFRVAHIDSSNIADIANEDYLMYDYPIGATTAADSVRQITGIVIKNGESLMIYASTANLSFVFAGEEEAV